ncbi:Meiotic Sister-Chromatid recombination aldehyde dehydrogenase [Saitoella coloradoensis]
MVNPFDLGHFGVLSIEHILDELLAPKFLAAFAALILVPRVLTWLLSPSEKAVAFTLNEPLESMPKWKGPVLDKPSIKGSSPSEIKCYCPATAQSLGTVKAQSAADIDAAINRAEEAQVTWAKTSFAERRKVLNTLQRFLLENQDEVARVACRDTGKTMVDAALGEILVTTEKIRWTLKHGENALKPEKKPTNLLMIYKKAEVRYEPLGVVAALVSWNYPLHNCLSPIIAALFSGNAIVVKGSELTAWSTQYFIQIARKALIVCGHSPELVQSITCLPDFAGHLTSHPKIRHITFIGSKPVAHKVAESAAQALTPLVIELGGKDAAVVLDDVKDLGALASVLMRGTFQSSGQNCIGIERIIALPKSYKKLCEILEPRVKAMRLGSAIDQGEGVDMGAMVSDNRFEHLEELIEQAVAQGAKLLAGGKRYTHPKFPKGHYFQPTLLVDVTPTMRIAQEELFAPVCVLMPATSVDNAIEIANSTDFGLGGAVFGSNQRDLDTVAREMRTGMVAINDFAVFYMIQLPFGGVRGSGYGRFAGVEGLRGLCNGKSVCWDLWPGVVETRIPGVVDYPIRNGGRAWGFVRGLIAMAYGETWGRKGRGLVELVKNSV